MRQCARVRQDKQSKIQEEKQQGPESIQKPIFQADVVKDRLDEKEAEIEHPEQRTPSVLLVPEYPVPRLQFEGTGRCAPFMGLRIGFHKHYGHESSIVALPLNSGQCAMPSPLRTTPERRWESAAPATR